ncbi:hypothetical protein M1M34_gp032 [Haloarcula tailed virus 2]|uniref:Uncharacterized protein n=1 Tax=Haloarcula tailed virus 2 TaxID=2877989 RepID=A0AAE9BYJ5_9CAUD|nr:hypothetical protein M1M34_gp032 [Haloarcula tailed virus 2]UBF23183.1 hypothetical protein HATV-2_gp32 [Haloarcula tailed virus 2]
MFGGANADFWETIRSTLIPLVGRQVAKLDSHTKDHYYVEHRTGRGQYICQINKSEEKFEEDLEDMGFERNPIAAFKTLAGTDHKEEGSWYKVDDSDDVLDLELPEKAKEFDREGQPDFQLHLILYEIDDDSKTTTVCGHHELWWGARPLGHYRGHYYSPWFGGILFSKILMEYYGDDFEDVVSFTPLDELLKA